MAKSPFRISDTLVLEPIASPTLTVDGQIAVDDTTDTLKVRLNGATQTVVTDPGTGGAAVFTDAVQTLTNKTIDGDNNTVQDLALTSIKTDLANASKFVERDAAGVVISGHVVPTGIVVGTTDTQTLTNKTLTSPVITTPTGITKADVGLNNVDNTSDATKNAATATLTNKTLTSPVINTPAITGGTIASASISSPIITNAQISIDDQLSTFALNLINESNQVSNNDLIIDVNAGDRTLDLSGNLVVAGNSSINGTFTGSSTGTHSGSSSGTNTGDVTRGAFSNTPDGFGYTLTGQQLALTAASNTAPGGLSIGTQNIGGQKIFKAGLSSETSTQIDGYLNYVSAVVSTSGAAADLALPIYSYTNWTGTATGVRSIAAGIDGQILVVKNKTGGPVTIFNEAAGATAANRISCQADFTLASNQMVQFVYDGTTGRWTLSSGAGTGSGSSAPDVLFYDYVLNPQFDTSTAGWATYADAAGNLPVDGTGGSPTVTIARTTTTPLQGSGSLQFVKPASNVQGQGFSYDFTIDRADRANVLQFSFDYEFVSGTYSFGTGVYSDLIVYIYDVTNGALIAPAVIKMDGGSIGTQYKLRATFQTASNSSSYRAIVHVSTATTAGFVANFDNFYVGRQSAASGFAGSDTISYTPRFGSTPGSPPTNSTITGRYSRAGDKAKFTGALKFSGAPSAFGDCVIELPLGMSIDTSKLANFDGNGQILGTVNILDSGAALYPGTVTYRTATQVEVVFSRTTTGTNPVNVSSAFPTQGAPFAFGNLDVITWDFEVPIAGWSSNVTQSSETDSRVVAFRATNTTALVYAGNAATQFTFNNIQYDTTAGAATNTWKAPFSGQYKFGININCGISPAVVAGYFLVRLRVNGTQVTQMGQSIYETTASVYKTVHGYTEYKLNAGDVVDFVVENFSGSNATANAAAEQNWVTIERLSGSAVVQATETVSFKAGRTGVQSVPNITQTTVLFNTVQWDTHNAYNSGTGTYTVPVSGLYEVKLAVLFGANSTGIRETYVLAGGVTETIQFIGAGVLSSANTTHAQGATQVRLLAGQTITGRCFHSSGGNLDVADIAGAQYTRMSIIRVGNY